jgi:tripartite-type tricarboxylate transporter receptor subunit TctC
MRSRAVAIFAHALAASLLAAGILAAGSAWSENYPSRPVTLIVPFPPGGATDAIARIIQDSMSQSLGQQIVIENIGGAGGMIAAGRAARAAPDGYTVLLHHVALAAGMTLYPKLAFDAERSFLAVGLVNTSLATLIGRATLPPDTMAELVRWLKEPGQNAKFANAGVGSFSHLTGVLAAQEIGATVTQVPYRGAGPALNDVLAGVADLSQVAAVVAGPLVKAGRIKAYATVGRTRFAGLPDLPTLGEIGYRKLELDFWHMLLVPAGTPRPIVERLNAALRDALANAKVRKMFEEGGMERFPPDQETPEAASALLKRELKLWGDVIRANNITGQ